jgi:pyruvate dehydrogenase E1 component alpha subunit/2-oxoisovalerate dehydrogenase E1 component alpha subunit
MQRFAAFDPPEYTSWTRVDADVDAFRETIARDPARAEVLDALDETARLALYRALVRNRLTDVALKRMVRQGVISKAWLGTGEEAATIGPVHALRRGEAAARNPARDVAAPMIRNGGACLEMGMSVADTLRAYMGTADGPSHGRDGHYGDLSTGVLPPISHVGDIVPVVTGIALSFRLRGQDAVAMTWIGDGSTKAGVAHEGLNFAAVQRAPVVFIIQNNQVALGTRLEQHHVAAGHGNFADWPKAYGMWGGVFDGNNVLDAYAATRVAAERCRSGHGPVILSAETFRMAGHATHDEQEARQVLPEELFRHWGKRDPIGLYEEHLIATGDARRDDLTEIENGVTAEVDRAADDALASREGNVPSPDSALKGVYAD